MLLRKNRNKNTVDEVNPFFLSENLSYKISKRKRLRNGSLKTRNVHDKKNYNEQGNFCVSLLKK